MSRFLDHERHAVVASLSGVPRGLLREPLVLPDGSLLALVKHLTFLERWWFTYVFAGIDGPFPWDTGDPDEPAENRAAVSKRGAQTPCDRARVTRVAIVGGGIAGLTTALSLQANGIRAEVFEQADAIRELGVGLNLLPPAVQRLADLGLLAELDRVSVRTNELILANRHGQIIWRERRGIGGGHASPQLSIHRGRLQRVLYDTVRDRLGPAAVHVDRRVVEVSETNHGPVARLVNRAGAVVGSVAADIVLGADGIHSTVRRAMYPAEGEPRWNGVTMWRGAVEWPMFLDGSSMIVAGGTRTKAVVYPIGPGACAETRLTNWGVVARTGAEGDPPPRREDWSRPADRRDVEAVLPRFSIGLVDLPGLVAATETIYEYPMCDREPLPSWTRGAATLIGDAAHPMYPMGSNGATQAIIDAGVVAHHVARFGHVDGLVRYELERRPVTSDIVRLNRRGGPEGIIDLVEERAPDGFTDLDSVISQTELRQRLQDYMRLSSGGVDASEVTAPSKNAAPRAEGR